MTYTLLALRALALSVGFPPSTLDTAAAIAMAESKGQPTAIGDSGNSIGLWQINIPSHPQMASWPLTDPTTNARAALIISKGGTNFGPWSTYSIAPYPYLRFLPPPATQIAPADLLAALAGVALAALAPKLVRASRARRARALVLAT